MDTQLLQLRDARLTWDAIAAAMRLSRNMVIERGRRIGARRAPPAPRIPPEDSGRPPRCPGHPDTWGLLINGTALDGTPYPYPVFI